MTEPRPLYIDGTVFGQLHPAEGDTPRDAAVVICPPFGWAEISSYRAIRAWAEHLAAVGYTTLRITLPATGDSGSAPRDPGIVDAWCAAVGDSCDWLRARAFAPRVAVIGLGLGGLVACQAVAAIDDLILWATPAHGRALIRELTVTSRLEATQYFEDRAPPPPVIEGGLETTGFVMSAETVAALRALEVATVKIPNGSGRRALLLERDGIAVDRELYDWLRSGGVAVATERGPGYGAMTAHPQQTQAPREVFAQTTGWLDEGSSSARSDRLAEPAWSIRVARSGGLAEPAGSVRVEWDGGVLIERPIFIELPSGRLPGVLSEPVERGDHGLCALLLNAGAIRRIGPGRMWVETARRWALRGVPTVRLDLEGIGDADGEINPYANDGALYVPALSAQAAGAVQALYELGLGERFVLGGLCSGAFWAFHTALEDPRVVAAYMLNPRALFWEESLQAIRDFRLGVRQPAKLRNLRQVPRARYGIFMRWALGAPARQAARALALARGRPAPDRVALALDRLAAEHTHVMLLFSEHEPLHEELLDSGHLASLSRWPNIELELVPGRDHTLRPLVSQHQAHQALDRALDRDLAAARAASARRRDAVAPHAV